LPYTLPQDSTLFLILGDRHPDLWFQKLDWIARHGGMALVNIHPDYIRFDGEPASPCTYPVELYTRFLEYARQRYAGAFWQPLPRELAHFVLSSQLRSPHSALPRAPRRICLAGALFYESDNRTMRYAEALRSRGDEVDVLALRRPGQPRKDAVNGINVFRIQERVRDETGIPSYLRRLSLFLFRSFCIISWRHLNRPYDIIHVHSIPDFEVFAALVPKLTGAKVILDIYDVLPEFYLSKFHLEKPDLIYRLLLWQERLSARFADHVISANHLWHHKLTQRSVLSGKCTPFVNHIDMRLFYKRARLRNDDRFIVVYPGTLNWHQGTDVALRAFKVFSEQVPQAEFHVYGEGPEKGCLAKLVSDLGLHGRAFLKDPVPLSDIPQILSDADMGVVGKRQDVFGNEAYSTKIIEYMSQGLPCVVPRTAIDAFYFKDSEVSFYQPESCEDMAAKMLRLYSDPELRQSQVRNGFECAKACSWEFRETEYFALIDSLTERTASVRTPHSPLPSAPRRICMVTYSHFLSDTRVMRYAEALAERGDHVDVLALKPSPGSPAGETHGNINVVNLQTRFGKKEKSLVSFLFPVLRFLAISSLWITRAHARKRYDLIHVHNVPDFLVFGAWFPKLTGAKIILDIHDIVPEFYASKFAPYEGALSIKLLKWLERASARFAHHVIISNHLWREKYAARTGANGKCSVHINNVDAKVFRPRPRARNDAKPIVIFPGGLQWHQGLDIAIRALPKVKAQLPDLEFHIYGDGNMKDELIALARDLGLNGSVRFFDPVPVSQVAGIMASADLGVVPKRADSFGNEAYSTKIMEFMAVGVPVVVSSTKIDRYYFNDSVVRFFESGNPDALAQAMLEVLSDAALRRRLIANASAYAAQNSWDSRKHDYLALVDSLIQS
jgi:glycosyltransferase involved in cell wall biosynthesis